jgi:hypothetical protein
MTESENAAAQTEQLDTSPTVPEPKPTVASVGPGQIFRDITPNLVDAELTNNLAAIKLILDRMRTAEADRDDYKRYVKLFHDSDKLVGIQNEKLKINIAGEITFGVGLTIGGALFGLVPYFWAKGDDHLAGATCIAVAAVLTVGSIAARAYYGSRK